MTIPARFEALIFLHALSVISSLARQKAMKVKMCYTTQSPVSVVVQSVIITESKPFQNVGVSLGLKALALYVLFDEAKVRFLFFSSMTKAALR